MILEQCAKMGKPYPKVIAEAPDLLVGLELFYEAFYDLTTCRGGMGDGPIPWTSIEEYCNLTGIYDEQRERMHSYIREMDTAFLEHHRKKK